MSGDANILYSPPEEEKERKKKKRKKKSYDVLTGHRRYMTPNPVLRWFADQSAFGVC